MKREIGQITYYADDLVERDDGFAGEYKSHSDHKVHPCVVKRILKPIGPKRFEDLKQIKDGINNWMRISRECPYIAYCYDYAEDDDFWYAINTNKL